MNLRPLVRNQPSKILLIQQVYQTTSQISIFYYQHNHLAENPACQSQQYLFTFTQRPFISFWSFIISLHNTTIMSKAAAKQPKKQVRKPVSQNFAPKRLAINFAPPTIIMQYLVVDTGKLYHHKMRLDSIMRKPNVTRIDILNYIKTKHCLYFLNGKVKDAQLLKFIDKIVSKTQKGKTTLTNIKEQAEVTKFPGSSFNQDNDFDYLDDDQYEQDYQDYEQPEDKPAVKPITVPKKQTAEMATKFNKNTFMTYCQEYEESNEEEGGAEWDLDMDESADYV